MLRGLYYPFSRCVEPSSLKQLLLVFDSITFLDPVTDEEWRAKLFRDLEHTEHRKYKQYRLLQAPLQDLKSEGAIVLRTPADLNAFKSQDVVASALSDLLDDEWCKAASSPKSYNLPHQLRGPRGKATWQIFPAKIPELLREILLYHPDFKQHILQSGHIDTAWTLSYEAGSATAINLHLAAAEELEVAPVTDSTLHHKLLLRKVVRSVCNDPKWMRAGDPSLPKMAAQQTAIEIVQQLLPKSVLADASFDSILLFRDKTKTARTELIRDLTGRLSKVSISEDPSEILYAQAELKKDIEKELKDYRADLASARDNVWPKLVPSVTTGSLAGIAAVGLQFITGGTMGIVAGSIASASLVVLKSALECRADFNKVVRKVSPSVAYLSQLIDG
jgi:hypothetical protein